MDELTFYSYRYCGGGNKKQIFITINCKNKTFRTNKNDTKINHSKYGFSNYEVKDYSELQELERCIKYKNFKEEKFEKEYFMTKEQAIIEVRKLRDVNKRNSLGKAMDIVLSILKEKDEEIEKKDKIEKEVADDIDKVAVELSKLSDNIFIVNQAMLLQKIAQEKLGKFYID